MSKSSFPEHVELMQLDRRTIRLYTLNNGSPHPSARTGVLLYTFEVSAGRHPILDMSITGSKLAIFSGSSSAPTTELVVWDWTTGQVMLVRGVPLCSSTFGILILV